MKKKILTLRTTEQIIRDMENLIRNGRYRDKTDVFHDAMRHLFRFHGIIQTNNARNRGRRR